MQFQGASAGYTTILGSEVHNTFHLSAQTAFSIYQPASMITEEYLPRSAISNDVLPEAVGPTMRLILFFLNTTSPLILSLKARLRACGSEIFPAVSGPAGFTQENVVSLKPISSEVIVAGVAIVSAVEVASG